MQEKAKLNLELVAALSNQPWVAACLEINHLKQLYRQGWLRAGISKKRCESVAEHIFGVAMLSWFAADAWFPDLDRDRLIRLALVHDLGEIYTGDVIPADKMPVEEKHRSELESVQAVLGKLSRGEEYLALWEEYERGETEEARLVRELDRLEMALQALVYHSGGFTELDPFIQSAESAIQSEELRGFLRSVTDVIENTRHD
jgi:putative hydrolase of HD superfamily